VLMVRQFPGRCAAHMGVLPSGSGAAPPPPRGCSHVPHHWQTVDTVKDGSLAAIKAPGFGGGTGSDSGGPGEPGGGTATCTAAYTVSSDWGGDRPYCAGCVAGREEAERGRGDVDLGLFLLGPPQTGHHRQAHRPGQERQLPTSRPTDVQGL
jgi:hypothetical protein